MVDIELDAMRILTTVAAARSFAGAAAQLGVSPQAVSARIRALEGRLARPLFVRSAGGVQPTTAGAQIASWAAEVLAAETTFRARLATLADTGDDRVRVAASLTIAEHLVPSWMVLVAARFGDRIDLAVTNSEDVVARLRDGRSDLGFVETTEIPGDLGSRVVARDELVLVTSPAHAFARRSAVTLGEVAATPLVTREAGSGTRTSYEQLCREHGIETVAPPAVVTPTTAGVRAAVAAGAGAAVLSTLAVRDDLALGRLVQVRIHDVRLVRPLTAVWHHDEPPTGAGALLLEVAGGTPATTPRAPSD